MDFKEFVKTINGHTKAFYQNDIDQINENSKIINWFLGLAGGGLLFSFNKYDEANGENIQLITFQAALFVLTIIIGILHRYLTKVYKNRAVTIMRMFDFLAIEFKLVEGNEMENDLEDPDEKMDNIFNRYVNGGYFEDDDKKNFNKLYKKQRTNYNINLGMSIFSVLLVLAQFAFFFVVVI
ncbi:hypothetical protein GWK08_15345 [Leptobacterium flavescens]|uniref:DUF4231 domain-containing protein n=1 Tax=Leptobacterium flavescens TaxID=472055 RepID=A0A6P0UN80_9FLAO|nr:hypothetical protein [Leptobacterium flavescens]NER14831.1 hypothetical protein [Leptobacterium flavescens]